MLKSVLNLIIAMFLMALSANLLHAQTMLNDEENSPSILPIRNLRAENSENCIISATWDEPYNGTGWFSLSSSDYKEGFETEYTDYIWAQRFPPAILASFGLTGKGVHATKMKFFLPNVGKEFDAMYELKIYQGTSSTEAGTELLSQPVSEVKYGVWNEIELKEEIEINYELELWIAVHSRYIQGEGLMAAKDNGPMSSSGNMIYIPFDGWYRASDLSPDFNANWMIAIHIVTPEGNAAVLGAEGLLGYNIYFNKERIGNTTECFYQHQFEETGRHEFSVAANYDSGEARKISALINAFCEDGCNPPENLQFEIEGDQLTLTWEVETDTLVSQIIRNGEKLEGTFTSPFTETIDIDQAYEYCVINICRYSESEAACIKTVRIDGVISDPPRIYPNPASSVVNIEKKGISKVEIYNISGQKIATKTGNVSPIDVSAYDEGVYFFKIYDINGQATTKSVMIVKF